MGNLIIIVGLPGSGKSRYIEKETARIRAAGLLLGLVSHDYMACSMGNDPHPSKSANLADLRKDLADGKTCIIADIAFTEPRTRDALVATLKSVPSLTIDWIYFANDLEQCLRNIGYVNATYHRSDSTRVAAARRFSPLYKIPDDVTPLPVGIAGSSP